MICLSVTNFNITGVNIVEQAQAKLATIGLLLAALLFKLTNLTRNYNTLVATHPMSKCLRSIQRTLSADRHRP
jgi:hypothetical protein